MRDFTDDAKLENAVQMVAERGFRIGMSVCRKADNFRAHIEDMQGDQVTLRTVKCEQVVATVSSFLNGEWAEYEPKPEPEELLNWTQYSPQHSLDFKIQRVKGLIMWELHELTVKHSAVLENLKVFLKPKKEVFASKGFEKGKLIIVPSTLKVDHKVGGGLDVVPANAVNIGTLLGDGADKVRFWLVPTVVMPKANASKCSTNAFVCPFFMVRIVHEIDEGNMEIVPNMDKHNGNAESPTIPVMRNRKAIKAMDCLTMYVPKVERKAHVEAFLNDERAGASGSVGEPPIKKARQTKIGNK
jgi:hypothetical protein